jgi:hypothetical protein
LHHLHTVFTGILWFTVQDPVPVVAGLAEVAALVPLFTAQIITGPLGGIMAIVAVSLMGGGNRNTRRKPPICRKFS